MDPAQRADLVAYAARLAYLSPDDLAEAARACSAQQWPLLVDEVMHRTGMTPEDLRIPAGDVVRIIDTLDRYQHRSSTHPPTTDTIVRLGLRAVTLYTAEDGLPIRGDYLDPGRAGLRLHPHGASALHLAELATGAYDGSYLGPGEPLEADPHILLGPRAHLLEHIDPRKIPQWIQALEAAHRLDQALWPIARADHAHALATTLDHCSASIIYALSGLRLELSTSYAQADDPFGPTADRLTPRQRYLLGLTAPAWLTDHAPADWLTPST